MEEDEVEGTDRGDACGDDDDVDLDAAAWMRSARIFLKSKSAKEIAAKLWKIFKILSRGQ